MSSSTHVDFVCAVNRHVDCRELVDVSEVEARLDDELLGLEARRNVPVTPRPDVRTGKAPPSADRRTYQRSLFALLCGPWHNRSTTYGTVEPDLRKGEARREKREKDRRQSLPERFFSLRSSAPGPAGSCPSLLATVWCHSSGRRGRRSCDGPDTEDFVVFLDVGVDGSVRCETLCLFFCGELAMRDDAQASRNDTRANAGGLYRGANPTRTKDQRGPPRLTGGRSGRHCGRPEAWTSTYAGVGDGGERVRAPAGAVAGAAGVVAGSGGVAGAGAWLQLWVLVERGHGAEDGAVGHVGTAQQRAAGAWSVRTQFAGACAS